MSDHNTKAKLCLQKGFLNEAFNSFSLANNFYGCAYCKFLDGNLKEASNILNKIKDLNPFVNWLLCLIEIINNTIVHKPTYFQIRNFYETDLDMLFLYKKFDFIEKIYNKIVYLSLFNIEVYKYSANVFLQNNMINEAILLAKKGIDVYYNDPEIHFIMAEIYLLNNDIENAKKEFIKSNEVVKGYYPAIKQLKKLALI